MEKRLIHGTTEVREWRGIVDRSRWPPGPWDEEPDKWQWRHSSGLHCMIVRSDRMGNLCGYAGLPAGHPFRELAGPDHDYDRLPVSVHGGVTYMAPCRPGAEDTGICHVPPEGEDDDIVWIGFDCAHAWDVVPGLRSAVFPDQKYRDFPYVFKETERLAEQAAAAWKETP